MIEQALAAALNDLGWEHEGLALVEDYDPSTGEYGGLARYNTGSFGQITDHTLVVQPVLAAEQQAKALLAAEPTRGCSCPGDRAPDSSQQPRRPSPTDVRFFGLVRVNHERYGRERPHPEVRTVRLRGPLTPEAGAWGTSP